MTSIHTLLNRYNLRPRKGLGQNFLTDDHHLRQIVAAADIQPHDTVLEIGPGPGTLTQSLTEAAKQVIAVEIDAGMVNLLRTEYQDRSNLRVVEADILKTELASIIQPPYKVVANLPYYITSAILRHVLESQPKPSDVIVLVQKEVAQRMVAAPGQMSILSVSVQFYGRPRLVHQIPPGAFYPPPKVSSAVVKIEVWPEPVVAVSDVEQFFHVVKAGFGQKRKQLKNSLTSGLKRPADEIFTALATARIAPSRRAQTLTLVEWAALANAL